jgi:hypothetical protein
VAVLHHGAPTCLEKFYMNTNSKWGYVGGETVAIRVFRVL